MSNIKGISFQIPTNREKILHFENLTKTIGFILDKCNIICLLARFFLYSGNFWLRRFSFRLKLRKAMTGQE